MNAINIKTSITIPTIPRASARLLNILPRLPRSLLRSLTDKIRPIIERGNRPVINPVMVMENAIIDLLPAGVSGSLLYNVVLADVAADVLALYLLDSLYPQSGQDFEKYLRPQSGHILPTASNLVPHAGQNFPLKSFEQFGQM